MEQWNASIKDSVHLDDPHGIIKAFKKGFELEETYWTYRSLYLSSTQQSQGESAAALTTRVEDLVNLCEWPDAQKEQRHINLFYHLTDFFNVKQYIQNEAARETVHGKLTEEAKHQERVGKEYARFRREKGGGGTPSYGDPALAADAVSRGCKKPQLRSLTPSGGKGGQPKQCDHCFKCNSCKGERGTCPAWGKKCGICPDAVQNSVTSEPSVPLSKAAKRGNSVLSGRKPSKAGLSTHNVFSCDSIHNTGDDTLDQYQTDTDPSGCLCIKTDILVRAKTTSQTHNIRVKKDPGADANLMPVHHFRTIFPYLGNSTGQSKEGVLERAESRFESYSRDNVTVIGQTKIYAKNIQTGKFLMTRIYVIARERGPILLSKAASQWLGLIAVLCENKAVPVRRYMASVTREETEGEKLKHTPIQKLVSVLIGPSLKTEKTTITESHHSTKEKESDQAGKASGICTFGCHP